MKPPFKEDGFFKMLFDAIPLLALIVNWEGRVFAVNRMLKNLVGITDEEAYMKKGGDVYHCIHAQANPGGCGYSDFCKKCVVRNTAMKAFSEGSVHRVKGHLEINLNNKICILNLLVSASPLVYKGEQFAAVILEDISLITELQGLLPICSSCKRIRDDNGYWNIIEKYLEKHSEAEFTHDICKIAP